MSDLSAKGSVVIRDDLHSRQTMRAETFLAAHAGHIITGTGPVVDGDCIISVRVCATCNKLHVAHNDEVARFDPPRKPQ